MSETYPDHSSALAALVGRPSGPVMVSPEAVNGPMIRHWVEAMGDHDPIYVSEEAARAEGLESVIAPPSMLQAWIMRGLRATEATEAARQAGTAASDSATDQMMALLDDEGMTSVVATNCDQTYVRPLVIGDRIIVSSVIEAISDIKATGLGTGRFTTTRSDFVAVPDHTVTRGADPAELFAIGEPVGSMSFRILKFRPKIAAPSRPRRPRPALTQDNAFFFEGAREGRLLIQHCVACGTLRHPPGPSCPKCRSFDWDTVTSSGRGELFSFVVAHYPQVPAFDYPLAIALIELEEGTRVVANVAGVEPADLVIGMKMVADFEAFDDELSLPVFRPAEPAGNH
jgi:uncharacterized OB-fold protein/acyl dehydratase